MAARLIAIAVTTIALLLLVGCSQGGTHQVQRPPASATLPTTTQSEPFTILSSIPYDQTRCRNTRYGSESVKAGLQVMLKDQVTGKTIDGSASVSTIYPVASESSSGTGEYTCLEGIDNDVVLVAGSAANYTLNEVIVHLSKNKLTTIELPMWRSCSGGPDLIDNLKAEAVFWNNKDREAEIDAAMNNVFGIIQYDYGLNNTNYTLSCVEASLSRGGYIRVKGSYNDGSPLSLLYHWGWCSSGGAECGWVGCINTTSNSMIDTVKSRWCNEITSTQTKDDNLCSFTNSNYDRTNETRARCFAGDFEKQAGGYKVLAITQEGSRCGSSANPGTVSC